MKSFVFTFFIFSKILLFLLIVTSIYFLYLIISNIENIENLNLIFLLILGWFIEFKLYKTIYNDKKEIEYKI